MASRRNLKKDINYVLGDLIENVYTWRQDHPDSKPEETEAIIDEAIVSFDEFMTRLNQRNVDNTSVHFKSIRNDLEVKANDLAKKINSL